MKSYVIVGLLFVVFAVGFVGNADAACDEAANKDSEEGDVKSWFKNIGCKIQKGAEDLGESAKPWAEKIGSSAKEFGSSVAQKYDEIKHKLVDENTPQGAVATDGQQQQHQYNAPTERVPLAPLQGEVNPNAHNNANNAPTAASMS